MTSGADRTVDYRFRRMLDRGEWIVSVELDPPPGLSAEGRLAVAAALREAGVDCIDVGDSPLASVRMSPLSFAVAAQERVGVEAIIHFTSRDRNLMALQSDLLGAHMLGLRSVIALSGDPPSLGRYANAKAVWDVKAEGLIELIAGLNVGVDSAGTPLDGKAEFTIATAANPNNPDLEAELVRMRSKAERGAHLFMTQPCYDAGVVERFLEKAQPIGRPVILGVMPLVSGRNARYMATEVPGDHGAGGDRRADGSGRRRRGRVGPGDRAALHRARALVVRGHLSDPPPGQDGRGGAVGGRTARGRGKGVREGTRGAFTGLKSLVLWRDFDAEAFRTAQAGDRLLFMVVAAPWSNESHRFLAGLTRAPRVAATLNNSYVPVLVDAEERLDIAGRYLSAGMPTLALVHASGEVLWAGAPLEPEALLALLAKVQAYCVQNRRELLERVRAAREEQVRAQVPNEEAQTNKLTSGLMAAQVRQALAAFDPEHHGFCTEFGFGGPKYPHLETIDLLLLAGPEVDPVRARATVKTALEALLTRGLWDQSEGGLQQCARERDWSQVVRVKRLEDNGMLLRTLCTAAAIYSDAALRDRARAVLQALPGDLPRRRLSLRRQPVCARCRGRGGGVGRRWGGGRRTRMP